MNGVLKSPLNTRQHIWAVMRQFSADGRPFTLKDIQQRCNSAHMRSVRAYAAALIKGGYLEVLEAETTPSGAKLHRVIRDCVRAPRLRRDGSPATQRRGQQQLWNAMRRLRSFDWRELAAVASTEACQVTPAAARLYISRLHRAGYLAPVHQPGPGRRGRWRLKINSGPRAPQIVRCVRDPNTGEIHMGEMGEAA
jgi:hypothetical protein